MMISTEELIPRLRWAEKNCLTEYATMAGTAANVIEELQGVVHGYRTAEEQGLLVRLPCKAGDICYEIDPGHGIVTHTVIGTTVYNRKADGVRLMTDFKNLITIDTQAIDDKGGAWPDHYTPEEWNKRILTREEAEKKLEEGKGK